MLALPKQPYYFHPRISEGFLDMCLLSLLKNREEFANWLTRNSRFFININVAVGLQHEVLFTDFDYHTY